MHLFLLGKYAGVKFLDHKVSIFLALLDTRISKVAVPIRTPTSTMKV